MGAAFRLPRMAPTSLRMDRLAACQNTTKKRIFLGYGLGPLQNTRIVTESHSLL